MKAYTGFAQVYDMFMSDIPYGEWADAVAALLHGFGIDSGLVLELGCGTGSITARLSEAGYDMIGVDSSAEMLQLAQEKKGGREILYLLQEMQEFELYGTVRAIVSLCDSMNYILEPEELSRVFSLADNYLDPGGVLIFDMKTEHFYRDVLGERVICDNREEASLIWENYYDGDEKINEYNITIYCQVPPEGKAGQGGRLYRRFEETHYQRAYSIGEVCELIEQSGLELLGVYNAFDGSKPDELSERVYFAARECRKQGQQ